MYKTDLCAAIGIRPTLARNGGFLKQQTCLDDPAAMPKFNLPIKDARLSIAFALMIALLIILWISGGASRADVSLRV